MQSQPWTRDSLWIDMREMFEQHAPRTILGHAPLDLDFTTSLPA